MKKRANCIWKRSCDCQSDALAASNYLIESNQKENKEKNTAQAPCPKCDGRGYRGGYCLDCGQYWHGEKNATTNARTVGKRFLEAWAISQAAFEHDYD